MYTFSVTGQEDRCFQVRPPVVAFAGSRRGSLPDSVAVPLSHTFHTLDFSTKIVCQSWRWLKMWLTWSCLWSPSHRKSGDRVDRAPGLSPFKQDHARNSTPDIPACRQGSGSPFDRPRRFDTLPRRENVFSGNGAPWLSAHRTISPRSDKSAGDDR